MEAPNTDLPVEPIGPMEAKHDLPSRDSVETSGFTSPSAVRDKVSTFAREVVVDLHKVLSPDSHEVLHEEPWIKGAVQVHSSSDHRDEARDIGWHKPVAEIPNPLIGGLSNSKLWSLIQRFNKVGILKYSHPGLHHADKVSYSRIVLMSNLFHSKMLAGLI